MQFSVVSNEEFNSCVCQTCILLLFHYQLQVVVEKIPTARHRELMRQSTQKEQRCLTQICVSRSINVRVFNDGFTVTGICLTLRCETAPKHTHKAIIV